MTDRSSEAGREFLQRRVSAFGLTAAIIFGTFLVIRPLTAALGDTNPEFFDSPLFVGHLAACLSFFGIWAVCSRGPLSARAIRHTETIGLITGAVGVNVMASAIPLFMRPDYILALALGFALTGRAVSVPSTARRTMGLAVVIGVMTTVAVYIMFLGVDIAAWSAVHPEIADDTPEKWAFGVALGSAAWWAVIVYTSSAASATIYGLRRNVRAAKWLGQYQLDSKLGEGGMGIVFKAHHALLRRPTAVKLLLPEKAGERAIERFEREVRLMATLRHPNTVTVFDYGRSPDGLFYYAMEYVDGATLGEIVSEIGAFDPARAVAVLRQATAAMLEAHGIGLIHRDIKPANIMLYLPHGYGIEEAVKVLDFGLVKEMEATETRLTEVGSITGTPQYMAPEAVRNPENVDARSDIYALGCVLFFLLTGEHLFDGESVMDVCAKHLHAVPDTVEQRLGSPVDERLEALVASCLSKEPEGRPQTARELRDRLDGLADIGAFTEHDAQEWWEEYGHVFDREHTPATGRLTIDIERAAGLTPSS